MRAVHWAGIAGSLLLLAGCLAPEEPRETGCATMHVVGLHPLEAPGREVVVQADRSLAWELGYVVSLVEISGLLANRSDADAPEWKDIGYRVHRVGNTTEFHLSPLEWVGLLHIVEDQAVAQGGAPSAPFEESGSYSYDVEASGRLFAMEFTVLHC